VRRLCAAIAGAFFLFSAVSAAPAGLIPIAHPATALANSPAPSTGVGDTRSSGTAPGFIGAPLLAIGAVLLLGATAAIATIAYVRLTGGSGAAEAGADGAANAPPGAGG
jgi:hypothetical protein